MYNTFLSSILNSEVHSIFRDFWHVVTALVLWQLWKARTELILRSIKPNLNYIKSSIKSEALATCIYKKIISTKEARLWFIDPQSALDRFLNAKRSSFLSNLLKDFDAVAFTDGVWATDKNKGGIGGFIYSKNMVIQYVFSGPSHYTNPLGTEVEACYFIRKSLGIKGKFPKAVICVDSKNVEEMFIKARARLHDTRKGYDIIKGITVENPLISIRYISRKWNQVADFLAKQGKD